MPGIQPERLVRGFNGPIVDLEFGNFAGKESINRIGPAAVFQVASAGGWGIASYNHEARLASGGGWCVARLALLHLLISIYEKIGHALSTWSTVVRVVGSHDMVPLRRGGVPVGAICGNRDRANALIDSSPKVERNRTGCVSCPVGSGQIKGLLVVVLPVAKNPIL